MNPLILLNIWGLMSITLGAFAIAYAIDEQSPALGCTAIYFAWVGMVMLYAPTPEIHNKSLHAVTFFFFLWGGVGIGRLHKFPYLAFVYWAEYALAMIWTLWCFASIASRINHRCLRMFKELEESPI